MKLKLTHTRLKFHAIVDSADYARLRRHTWYPQVAKNAIYVFRRDQANKRKIYLHRDIMGPARGQCVDHINHDGLDNRRANLRLASYSENHANRRPIVVSASGYIGVYKSGPKWRARIRINGKHCELGSFGSPEIAAMAFQTRHIQHHGEFSIYNRRA